MQYFNVKNIRMGLSLLLKEWAEIKETMYLSNINGLKKSIKEGQKSSLSESVKEEDLNW